MEYKHGPDSFEQEGVPRGSGTKFHWKSQFYRKETVRDYWVYVPSQYNETNPSGLMIFNDGHFYVDNSASFRVPTVFDNLIHQKRIPPLIGILLSQAIARTTQLQTSHFERASVRMSMMY